MFGQDVRIAPHISLEPENEKNRSGWQLQQTLSS